jgi:hypothetical protein
MCLRLMEMGMLDVNCGEIYVQDLFQFQAGYLWGGG